jgi:hypothetical protein
MFVLNEDLSIYATRGDIVFFTVSAAEDGKPYKFQAGDVLRIKIYGKKDAEAVVLQKDFPVYDVTETVEIFLTEADTKIGEVISKPKDYWYEVELNPGDNPQTIIGYSEDGPAVFKLFPEGDDIGEYVPDPEDFPVVDEELDMASPRPIANSAVAKVVASLQAGYEATHKAVSELHVTPQIFGAIGDGVADDTESLEAMLETGGNIFLPEGTYVTSRPLYVNANTTTISGTSSRSVIKASSNFPEGEAVVTFYSPKGDYYTRSRRENTHGNFAVIGNNKTCNGVRFGGAVGSEYEGAVESSIFRNIFVDKCDAAYVWGAHAYRNTLIQCDSHSNNYSLKTADDITDVGEVFTCINCGFWSGALYLVNCGEIMMHSCTIHTKASQMVEGVEMGHYFKDTFVSFQNCHFEAILQSAEEKAKVYAPQFWAKNSLVYLSECTGVISSDTYMSLASYMFKDESDNSRSHGIYITGGQWKYYFGRIRPQKSLCSGSCDLKNISLKYKYDGITIPYCIYEDTNVFRLKNAIVTYDTAIGFKRGDTKASLIVEQPSDSDDAYTISFNDDESAAVGIYRKVDVTNYKTCIINGTLQHTNNTTDKSTLAANASSLSIIIFVDKDGYFVSWNEPHNVDFFTDGNTITSNGRFIAIPPRAQYALIGFDIRRGGGFWNLPTSPIKIKTDLKFEFI